MTRKLLALLGISATLLASCGKSDIDSAWNRAVTDPLVDSKPQEDPNAKPGEEPILRTAYCFPDENGPYGDTVKYTDGVIAANGHDGGGDYDWGQVGACVNRPIAETEAALRNLYSMQWDDTTSMSVAPQAAPEGTTHYYQANYVVKNSFPLPTVDWTMDWYYSVRAGTVEAPKQVVINYKKVKGTKYIGYWEGTVVLDYIRPGVTSITVRDQINASRTNSKDSEAAAASLVKWARNNVAAATADDIEAPLFGKQLTTFSN